MSAQVYRCFDEGGSCLYIGSTTDVDARMVTHTLTTVWAVDVDRVDVTDHASTEAAREHEFDEIKRLRPRWNIHGRGGRETWQPSDYVEVMIATHARRDNSAQANDIHAASRRIKRLSDELIRRFPTVGPIIVADVTPHLPPPPEAAVREWEARKARIRAEIEARAERRRLEFLRAEAEEARQLAAEVPA